MDQCPILCAWCRSAEDCPYCGRCGRTPCAFDWLCVECRGRDGCVDCDLCLDLFMLEDAEGDALAEKLDALPPEDARGILIEAGVEVFGVDALDQEWRNRKMATLTRAKVSAIFRAAQRIIDRRAAGGGGSGKDQPA